MGEQRLVVVGASLAGVRAVEGARRAGHDGPVTLIGAEEHLPYDRPPLSKQYLDPVAEAELDTGPSAPPLRTEQVLRDKLGVDLLLGEPATALDTVNRTVHVGERSVGYHAAVIATGSRPRALPFGTGLRGVHTLRTVDDAHAIRSAFAGRPRVVVVGAGFIGSEVASAARRRELDVTVVELLPTPLARAVGEPMGAACAALHARNGTELRCGVGVAAIDGDDGAVSRVVLADGTVLPADLVVVGAGAAPATDWLAGSGLTVDDGVVCDQTLSTGTAGVYAAGDVARWFNPAFGRSMRVEHWTSAAEQGMLAGRNAVDPAAARPYAAVPYFWSDWYGSRIQFLGVAASDEVTVVHGDVDSGTFVALYRDGDRLAGAIGIDAPAEIMRFRAPLLRGCSWADALELAASRRAPKAG